ncbi:NAD(P)H-dependent oxidoreductase, partial [Lentibacillus sp. L22]|uniref:NADPH-dependent FMN reductase n=1 Tax=Lentibacillus sp. L22 TaxID=3163028 RepID=UPI0034655004
EFPKVLYQIKVRCHFYSAKVEVLKLNENKNIKEIINAFNNSSQLIWVVPEYNWSYPGVIKMLVEQIGVELLQEKFNIVISVSIGPSSRNALSSMANLLFSMNSITLTPGVEINNIRDCNPEYIQEHILPPIKNLFYFSRKVKE